MPVAGIISDGQHSIRKAVAKAFSGVPHQLCPFHDLREGARPIYAADRHAKVELKKKTRGVRAIARKVEGRTDAGTAAVRRVAVCGEPFLRAVVVVDREADLLEVVLRSHPRGRRADFLNGGQEWPNQDRNDRDHHQKLDQCEAGA